MSSNINSISAAMAASVYMNVNGSSLPDYIVEKLTDLGIDSSNISSVSEAQSKIKEAEEAEKAEEAEEETEEDDESSNSSVRDRIETLAGKVGVSFNDDDSDDDIMDDIEEAIEAMYIYSAQANDPALFKRVEGYESDFNLIQAQILDYTGSKNSSYSFDDLLAEYNKYSLGLYKQEERDKKE